MKVRLILNNSCSDEIEGHMLIVEKVDELVFLL